MFQVSRQAPVPTLAPTGVRSEDSGTFLCLCNALTDTQVADAIQHGARHPRDVYARCGCRAHCGRCTTSIVSALRVRAAA